MKKSFISRWLRPGVATLLAATMLAGCSSSGSSSSGSSSESGTVELTVHDIYGTDVADFSLPVAQELQKRVGVTLTNTISASSTDESQAWTLMISNPDSMPDIVVSSDMSKIEDLGMDGGLIPLEDLIEEKCPNIVAAFEKYPELKTASTASDGHIYQVAGMKEMSVANVWVIRQDWLDKLNLEMPTTTDELYTVLKAFRDQDPNGNGQQDETPFITRWLTAPDNFTEHALSLFCSSTGLMVRQGEVVFDPMEEDFKTGMEALIQWYAEGLIDPEVFTRDDARNVMYGNNLGGLTYDWAASTTQYNKTLADSISGFQNVVMAPVQAPNGRTVVDHRSVPFAGAGITQNCENVDDALRLIDYLYSDEGQILMTYGIEGETYTIDEDGNYQFTEDMLNNEAGLTDARQNVGCLLHLGGIEPMELEYAVATNEETLAGYELYMEHPEWYPEDEYFNFNFKYTTEESDEINQLLPGITDFVNEKCMGWILGNGNFESEYDSFITELHNRGVDRVVEISQTAYDRLKGN